MLRAKAVMSTLDPHTHLPRHGGRGASAGLELKEAVDGWAWDKWSFNTLHIAADEPPRYDTDDPWIDDAFATVIGIESVDQLIAHWDNVAAGKLDLTSFGGHSTCESLFDPTLSDRPGKYVSMFQIHAPYGIEGGWESHREEVQEAMLAKWQKAAPNLTPREDRRHQHGGSGGDRDPLSADAPRFDQAR